MITKIGCDFIANKMQGKNGALFTAAYVKAFEKMRHSVQQSAPKTASEMFLLQAQINMEAEQRINRLEARQTAQDAKIEGIAETFAATPTEGEAWQEETRKKVTSLAEQSHTSYQDTWTKLYERLEREGHCRLSVLRQNARDRMRVNGATVAQQNNVSKLQVISENPRLRAIFSGILREEMARQFCGS